MIIVMLILVLLVIATSGGVLFWFYRRLNRIEIELWGDKRREAARSVEEPFAEHNQKIDNEG